MRLASKGGVGFWEAQAFRWFRIRKRARQFFKYRPGCPKTVLLIVGCQRSGTSMLHHLFRLDPDTVTYDEVSPLSAGDRDQHLRWTDPDLVRRRIGADRAPLVVAKPLVESQNTIIWLDAFPASRAIWAFRHYADVATSNVEFFRSGTSRDDLAPILAGDQGSWKAQHLDVGDREAILSLHRPDLAPLDAAALFWYARNSLFFSRGLEREDRVRTCNYDDLVGDPEGTMSAAYRFLGRPYPGDRITRDVTARSVGRGRDLPFEPGVREICEGLMERLRRAPSLTGS